MTVLTELFEQGAVRVDRPHAVGAGRGAPLIHRQALRWRGVEIHLCAERHGGVDEISLELPPWDELVEQIDDEDDLWTLIDSVAATCDAQHGAIGDGEPLEDDPLDPRRHVGLIVVERDSGAVPLAAPYTVLPRSGLCVLLR